MAGVRKELTIYGDDFPTLDGTCVRDYIHVVDLADADILALGALRGGHHEIINLGNGEGFSVYQVAGAVRRVTGRALPTVIGARRAGDPAMPSPRMRRLKPCSAGLLARPDLETMIDDAWDFFQSRTA